MTSAARLACCLAVLVCALNIASARIVFGGSGKPRQPPHARPPHPPHPHGALGAPCELPDGGFGVCSRIQECPSLMEHLRSGNVALLKQLVCGKSRGQTLLCCASKAAPPPTTPPPTIPPTPELPTADLSDPEACGITRLYVPPKVVGGEPVQSVGTFPWVAALRYSQGKTFQCGAAVIARRWLLTAGHCVNIPGGPVSVRVGDVNLYSPTDDDVEHPPQDIEIEQAIRHPHYKRTFSGITNDIALIQLKGDIEFSDVAKPICLPKKKSEVHPSGEVVIAGWGLTEAGGMVGTNVMQYADLNITDIITCQQSYHRSRVQRVNPEQHLCARGAVTARLNPGCMPGDTSLNCQGAPDACMGDSGGPLMSFEKLAEGAVRLTSVGVVSFAIGCGSALHPGVYARVDAYVDWIQDTLAARGGR